MPKQKAINDTKKQIETTEPGPAEQVHTELDPEVLEALNAKKFKKAKQHDVVDYIPELERDENDFDSLLGG